MRIACRAQIADARLGNGGLADDRCPAGAQAVGGSRVAAGGPSLIERVVSLHRQIGCLDHILDAENQSINRGQRSAAPVAFARFVSRSACASEIERCESMNL